MSAPEIRKIDVIDPQLQAQMIDLWQVVTEGGGAVGLRPGATRDDYQAVLDKHIEQMESGAADFYSMWDGEELLGFAWWVRGMFGGPHVATIKRLMITPKRHGQGLGKMMMDFMHSAPVLERLEGVDFLHLQYRVGDGLGGWYATFGYQEIARYSLFHKKPDGTYGGWAEMLRTIDGSPLPVNDAL